MTGTFLQECYTKAAIKPLAFQRMLFK